MNEVFLNPPKAAGSCFAWLLVAVMTPGLPAASVTVLSNAGGGQIAGVDTSTNAVTPLFNAGAGNFLDSLVFSGPNQIVYTQQGTGGGQLMLFNTSTSSNSVLATLTPPGIGLIKDLTLDPGGASVTVSLNGPSAAVLDRVNLTTHVVTTLATQPSPGNDLRGLTYDGAGHLFAVVDGAVEQLDPATGAVLHSSAALPATGSAGAMGITFDPSTGMLFVTDDANDLNARGVYELPTSLASATLLAATKGVVFADGLTADGHGNLILADANVVDQYNIAGGVLTPQTVVPGVTDVALTPSTSPPPGVPEPGTMSLFGFGLTGLAWQIRRRVRK